MGRAGSTSGEVAATDPRMVQLCIVPPLARGHQHIVHMQPEAAQAWAELALGLPAVQSPPA